MPFKPTATPKEVTIEFEPFGANAELFSRRDSQILICGPAGTGKTRAVLEKIHLALQKYPGAKCLMVRQTLTDLKKAALSTYREEVKHQADGVTYFGGNRVEPEQYQYPNGSRLHVGGLDVPNKVMSTQYDLIYVNEAIETNEGAWEALTTRLRNNVMPYQQIIGDTNPGPATHWLKRRVDDGKTAYLTSRHQDNPVYWDRKSQQWTPAGDKYVQGILAKLGGVRYQRLYEGRWVSLEGVVYPEWSPDLHVIDRFKIPSGWRRFRVIDFGYTHPFVCLWAALDPETDRLYIYREIYKTKTQVSDHARQINKLTGAEQIEVTIADHDAEDRATLAASGIKTIPARKKISPGLQHVRDRLVRAADGQPRLFIFRDALVETDPELVAKYHPTSIIQEFDSYMWPVDDNNKPFRDVPVKQDDHATDACRYLCQYLAARIPKAAPLSIERTSVVRNIA